MLLLLLLVPLAVAIALTAALSLWGRRISRRAGCPSWVRHVPWAIAVCGALGAASTAHGFIASFRGSSAQSDDASQKARVLAEAISEAMNGTAMAVMVLAGWAVVLMVLTFRYC